MKNITSNKRRFLCKGIGKDDFANVILCIVDFGGRSENKGLVAPILIDLTPVILQLVLIDHSLNPMKL
eukprot:1529605-Amphidinium_carterae.1